MLKFSEYLIDQALLNAETEEIEEGILDSIRSRLSDSQNRKVDKARQRASRSTDPDEISKLLKHPNLEIQLTAAGNIHAPAKALRAIIDSKEVYKSVQNRAERTFKQIEGDKELATAMA